MDAGDVARETEAPYCTEHPSVNAEATWTESGYTYPERSDSMLATSGATVGAANTGSDTCWYYQKSAEAIVFCEKSRRRAEC